MAKTDCTVANRLCNTLLLSIDNFLQSVMRAIAKYNDYRHYTQSNT